MLRVFPGRFTANFDGPFVVFLIGMRINQLWAFHKWIPVAGAMPPMLATLTKNPAKGLLGVHTWMRWPGGSLALAAPCAALAMRSMACQQAT